MIVVLTVVYAVFSIYKTKQKCVWQQRFVPPIDNYSAGAAYGFSPPWGSDKIKTQQETI